MTRQDNDGEDAGFWDALWREALVAMTLGWDLALPIFGGVLLGYFLDRWLGTGHVFTLGLLIMGIMAGYYNVAQFIRRVNRLDREHAARKKAAQEKTEDGEDA
jgi:ATP synthase protein I